MSIEKTQDHRVGEADLRVGDFVSDRYQIRAVLGSGGMAVVYKARDMRLRRDVAVKVLLPALRGQWRIVQRFSREGQAMAALDSPHVVPVYDVGQERDRPFIVMKLVEAPTLADLIDRDGPLEETHALRIAAGVLRGLADLHDRGIVHRDIKPSNVVVEGGRVMILDFGIALDTTEPTLTAEGVVVGTPSYMSPEQLIDPSRVDGRTDLYAVGVLLFEVLSGKPPFDGDTPTAVAMGHATLPPPDLLRSACVSERTAAIVARALKKSPDDRFQSADEMLDALEGRERLQAAPEVALKPPGRPILFPLLLLSLLILCAGALLLIPLSEQAASPPIQATPLPPLPGPAPVPIHASPAPVEEAEVPLVAPRPKSKPAQPAKRTKRPEPKRSPKPKVETPRAPPRAALPGRNPEVRRAQEVLAAGDTRTTIRLLNEVIRKNPNLAEPYATLGDAYAGTGNQIAAIAAYRRYLALESDGPGARRVEAALDRLGGR